MQLVGGNNAEWIPDEVKRIVSKLGMKEAESLEWRVGEDRELLTPVTEKKKGSGKRKKSLFAVEQQTKLFTKVRNCCGLVALVDVAK